MRASSVPGPVPARDDTLLVTQRDVAFRQLARRGVEGRIADAAARRHGQNLLDRGPGLVPELDPERQVLAPGQVRGGSRGGRAAVLLRLAGGYEPVRRAGGDESRSRPRKGRASRVHGMAAAMEEARVVSIRARRYGAPGGAWYTARCRLDPH